MVRKAEAREGQSGRNPGVYRLVAEQRAADQLAIRSGRTGAEAWD
jgi:hypothetical protein